MITRSDSTMPSVGEVCSQPGIITAVLVLHVFGDIGDGAAILAAQTKALDHPLQEQDDRCGEPDHRFDG